MAGQRFLYPRRRQTEMLSALFAGGFGFWCAFIHASTGRSAIYWASPDEAVQNTIATVLIAAAVVHAMGIRINGAWRCSPCLRFAGMAAHCAVFGFLWWHGASSSAAYVYAWLLAALGVGTFNAALDSWHSLRGAGEWTEA
jgi:hypothetical protein